MIKNTMKRYTFIVAIFGILPVFFLPLTQNFYDTNKWMLLTVGTLVILVLAALHLLMLKLPVRLAVPVSSLGFSAMGIASIIGLFAASTNKVEALLSPLGPVTWIGLTVLTWAAYQPKQEKTHLTWALTLSGSLLGLIALYQALGVGKLMFPGIPYLADPLWTPTGTTTTTIAVLAIIIAFLIPQLSAAIKKRHEPSVITATGIALLITVIGLAVTFWQFIPKIPANILPFSAGWQVAANMFKNPTTAIVGYGVENFVTAYTAGKPANLNTTSLFQVNFTTNADFFLHMLTVYGLIGLAAACIFVIMFLKVKNAPLLAAKIVALASLLLLPPTLTLLAVVAVVAILSEESERSPKAISMPVWSRLTFGVLLLLVSAISGYFLIRSYSAELTFFRSLLAAQQNDGTKTYNLQIQTIEANSLVTRYHITYSQTSLSLANSIASTETTTGTTSAQNSQLIAQLVQQAIREAKIAVTLNMRSVAAWENLGLTYQTIIPAAAGADNWAITAYSSAAQLDPSNPTLFLNIGGIYIHQKEYDKAIDAFQHAIQLAPSYTNAYYNLANAYMLKNDTGSAVAMLSKVLTMVEPGSTDYYKVKNQLDTLQNTPSNSITPIPATTSPSQLTLPQ